MGIGVEGGIVKRTGFIIRTDILENVKLVYDYIDQTLKRIIKSRNNSVGNEKWQNMSFCLIEEDKGMIVMWT